LGAEIVGFSPVLHLIKPQLLVLFRYAETDGLVDENEHQAGSEASPSGDGDGLNDLVSQPGSDAELGDTLTLRVERLDDGLLGGEEPDGDDTPEFWNQGK